MVQLVFALSILSGMPGVADIGGEVRNAVTGAPVAGVVVTAAGRSDTSRTDARGRFRFSTDGDVRLRFTREGFAPVEVFAVRGDTSIRVVMTPTPRTLEAATYPSGRPP